MVSVDIVHRLSRHCLWTEWMMSMDSVDIVHGLGGHCPWTRIPTLQPDNVHWVHGLSTDGFKPYGYLSVESLLYIFISKIFAVWVLFVNWFCSNLHKKLYITSLYWFSVLYIFSQKETSVLHLCLCIQNKCSYFIQLFCFNNADHLAMLCTKKKSIRWSLAPITMLQASVPTFQKSQNQYLICPPFSLTVTVHPCLTERTHCGVVMSARCIPCCHDCWHKFVQ